MTPERLQEITDTLDRKHVAGLLGYSSENSLRQCEQGRQSLPAPKAEWLETYAQFCLRQKAERARWLKENPPPSDK